MRLALRRTKDQNSHLTNPVPVYQGQEERLELPRWDLVLHQNEKSIAWSREPQTLNYVEQANDRSHFRYSWHI